jgi:hypothetical protein
LNDTPTFALKRRNWLISHQSEVFFSQNKSTPATCQPIRLKLVSKNSYIMSRISGARQQWEWWCRFVMLLASETASAKWYTVRTHQVLTLLQLKHCKPKRSLV